MRNGVMEEWNERDARVTRSNQEHFHSIIKTSFVPYNVSFYRISKEKLRRSVAPFISACGWRIFLPRPDFSEEGGDVERMRRRNLCMRQLRVAEFFCLLLRVRIIHLAIMLEVNSTGNSTSSRQSNRQSLPQRTNYWCAFSDCLKQRKSRRC